MTNEDLYKRITRSEVIIPEDPPAPTIVIDTREQKPYKFSVPSVLKGLNSGDYSIVGYENDITVERKSLPDLVRCCGRERQRFFEQCRRLALFDSKLLVVEADWQGIAEGKGIHPKSRVTPAQIEGTLLAIADMGIPFITAESRKRAQMITERYLISSHRRYWKQYRSKFVGR